MPTAPPTPTPAANTGAVAGHGAPIESGGGNPLRELRPAISELLAR